MSQNVYFIQEGHDGPIKIGCARYVSARLSQLQMGNWKRLQVLGVIPGASKTVERDWHRRFASIRVFGEWFAPTVELLQAILDETNRPGSAPGTHITNLSLEKQRTRDDVTIAGWVDPKHRKAFRDSEEAA